MKNFKYVLLSIILFIICPEVNALCSDADKVKYQDIAKNITASYDFVDESTTFNITFTNVNPYLYFKELNTGGIYGYTGNEMVLFNFVPGNSYKFDVYTNDPVCSNEKVYTLYVTVPYYNYYYQNELCNGIENYKFCQKFVNNFLTYSSFEENVTNYRKSLEKENAQQQDNDEVKNLMDYILDIYLNYYYIILPLIIVICLFIRWRYNKNDDLF